MQRFPIALAIALAALILTGCGGTPATGPSSGDPAGPARRGQAAGPPRTRDGITAPEPVPAQRQVIVNDEHGRRTVTVPAGGNTAEEVYTRWKPETLTKTPTEKKAPRGQGGEPILAPSDAGPPRGKTP